MLVINAAKSLTNISKGGSNKQYLTPITYATTMVSKLLGYNFLMEYKKGQDNKVIDTLSKSNEEEEEEFTLLVIFYPTLEWLTDLKDGYIYL
jgi:hypothetical protein